MARSKETRKRLQIDASQQMMEDIAFICEELGIVNPNDAVREAVETLFLLTALTKRGERVFLGTDPSAVREIFLGKLGSAMLRRDRVQTPSAPRK